MLIILLFFFALPLIFRQGFRVKATRRSLSAAGSHGNVTLLPVTRHVDRNVKHKQTTWAEKPNSVCIMCDNRLGLEAEY